MNRFTKKITMYLVVFMLSVGCANSTMKTVKSERDTVKTCIENISGVRSLRIKRIRSDFVYWITQYDIVFVGDLAKEVESAVGNCVPSDDNSRIIIDIREKMSGTTYR
ncbi:MAG: hypothetical protein GY861_22495 [bacterium]|nr:hypothetical protein [bacterium]